MVRIERRPLGELLRRPPRYGINAAAVAPAPRVPTYIRITDINDLGNFAPNPKVGVAHRNASHFQLGPGELVFARTGASVGKSYLYDPRDGELVYAGFLINVAPDPKRLNPKYLALFAQSKEYWDWIARTSTRSGQPGVNAREYAELAIPLPKIATQNAIADAMTDVDDLASSLERLIAKKQAIKQGMMQRLLTGKVRLPGFDGTWANIEVGDLLTFKNGLNKGREYFGAGTPIVNFMDVMSGPIITAEDIDGRVTLTKNEIRRFSARSGDLFFTRTSETVGEVGTAATLVDNVCDAAFSGFILRGRPKTRELDSRFMAHLFQLDAVRQQIVSLATYTTRALTSGRSLGRVLVRLPDAEEQRAVADLITDVEREITVLRGRYKKAQDVKQGMMQELLTGRTRLLAQGAAA